MERIASFTVDHNVLTPGLYLSRRDGNVVTFDLRFKRPNTGDLLSNSEMHSVEHVIATLSCATPNIKTPWSISALWAARRVFISFLTAIGSQMLRP